MSLSKKKDQITALYLKGSKLLIGSETGQVLSMNVDEPSNVCEIFRNPEGMPISQIYHTRYQDGSEETSIIAQNTLQFENGDEVIGTKAYLVRNNEVISVGEWASCLLPCCLVLQYDGQFISYFSEQKRDLVPFYSLELFMGTNIFDFDGVRYLAINRANQSSTIYTIDLKAENLEYDVFSFEGRYLSNLDLDNIETDNNGEVGEIGVCPMDDLDDEDLRMQKAFHALINPNLVLEVHHPQTYLDFVKVVRISPKLLYVVSAGRDHKVIVSSFFSHSVFMTIECESLARCGVYDHRQNFYFGCDNGEIGVINLIGLSHSFFQFGEDRFVKLMVSDNGKVLAALTCYNAIMCIDLSDFSLISIEEYDTNIKDFSLTDNQVIVVTETGDLYYQAFD